MILTSNRVAWVFSVLAMLGLIIALSSCTQPQDGYGVSETSTVAPAVAKKPQPVKRPMAKTDKRQAPREAVSDILAGGL